MSVVDDILFSPITPASPRRNLVDEVMSAFLNPIVDVQFRVDPNESLVTYDRIADIIQNDRKVFKAARQLCMVDPTGARRPPGSLTIKDVFCRIHQGQNNFHWAGKRSVGSALSYYKFTNDFMIIAGLPIIGMSTGNFEVYVLGLLSNFAGYDACYCFSHHDAAYAYWYNS